MEKLELNKKDISIHNVIYAITTQQDYEMTKYLFIEPNYDSLYNKLDGKKIDYIVAEGGHCSCYDWEDTEFDFMGYTRDELIKLVEARLEKPYYSVEEKALDSFIKRYLGKGE